MTDFDSDTKACPYCGEQILKVAKKCRFCGEFLTGKSEPVQTNVKQGALIGSITCLALACIIMVISLWTFIFYVPLLIASFILSIVAIAQKRVLGGVSMILANLILPIIIFGVLTVINLNSSSDGTSNIFNNESNNEANLEQNTDVAGFSNSEKNAESKYIDNIELYDFKAKYHETILYGNVPGVTFKLRNNGDSTLTKVEVTVFFKDENDNIIFEENYLPVYTSSLMEEGKPLKPSYIWQMENNKFYPAKNAPDEWEEGNATVKIADIEFANSIE